MSIVLSLVHFLNSCGHHDRAKWFVYYLLCMSRHTMKFRSLIRTNRRLPALLCTCTRTTMKICSPTHKLWIISCIMFSAHFFYYQWSVTQFVFSDVHWCLQSILSEILIGSLPVTRLICVRLFYHQWLVAVSIERNCQYTSVQIDNMITNHWRLCFWIDICAKWNLFLTSLWTVVLKYRNDLNECCIF